MFAHLIERYITSEVDSIGKSCKNLKPCVEQLFNFFCVFFNFRLRKLASQSCENWWTYGVVRSSLMTSHSSYTRT